MRLFTKIAITLACAALLSSAGGIAAVSLIFLPQYQQMDHDAATANATRVFEVLHREQGYVESAVGDWGNWDETYDFALKPQKGFIERNLTDEALQTIHTDQFLITDLDGNIRFSHRAGATPTSTPAGTQEKVPSLYWPNKSQIEPRKRFSGLVSGSQGPAFVALTRITNSKLDATAPAVLMLCQELDLELLQALKDQAGTGFELRKSQGSLQGSSQLVTIGGQRKLKAWITKTPDKHVVTISVPSIAGPALYELIVTTDLSFSKLANEAIVYVAILLLLISLAVGGALVWFMRKSVTQPLEHIISHTRHISETGDLRQTLGLSRKDELGTLSLAFDQMIGQLRTARHQIQEMSYASGMATAASDMLHNIRNSLTPVATAIWKGRESLKSLKTDRLAEIGLALANKTRAPELNPQIGEYVTASAEHIAERAKQVTKELETIQDFTGQIESVLRHHEEMSRGNRHTETFEIRELISPAEKIFLANCNVPADVTCAPKDGTYLVSGQRVVLRQILENIALNAAQAINRHKPRKGLLQFELAQHGGMMEIKITDNGSGFAASDTDKLFTRGYTASGETTRGLGLHFCATNIQSMRGAISAQSRGLGHGATFTIKLPTSQQQESAA